MVRPQPASPTSTLVTGFVAGAVAAFIAASFLFLTAAHINGRLVGIAVEVSPFLVTLAWRFLINLGWGIAYAYLAARTPQLIARPLTSGIVFGLFVLLMTVVYETGGKVANWPTLGEAGRQMIGYAFFYGLPLAYLTARRMKSA